MRPLDNLCARLPKLSIAPEPSLDLGSHAAQQADPAGEADRRMNRASVTSCCSTSDQPGSAGSNHLAEGGPAYLNALVHDSKGKSKSKELAIQPLTIAPKVDIRGKQSVLRVGLLNKLTRKLKICGVCTQGAIYATQPGPSGGAAAVGPASTTATRGVNISGIDGSNAIEAPQGDGRVVAAADVPDAKTIASNLQSLSIKDEDSVLVSSTDPATVTNQGSENHSVPEKDEAMLVSPSPDIPTECAAEVVSESTSLDKKKSIMLPSPQEPTHYIRAKGPTTGPPLVPLGERCPLCRIDLAFAARGDSQSGDLPFAAVLPCRHSYHDSCLRNLFGDVEPPCIQCLGI